MSEREQRAWACEGMLGALLVGDGGDGYYSLDSRFSGFGLGNDNE